MSAYGSYAPTTTDIYTDNTLICYINCLTSLLSGFAVFSILGNMASRSTAISAGDPALRVEICKADEDNCAAFDCSTCLDEGAWNQIPGAESPCCGNFDTDNVATGGVFLVFAVRRPSAHALSSLFVMAR